jgi:hypothetical protein
MAPSLLVLTLVLTGAPDAAALRERGAPGLAAIRAAALSAHVKFLADDLLEGRAPGTRGHALAERYAAAAFEAAGLEPAGPQGTWLQEVNVRRWIVDGARSRLTVRARGKPVALAWERDYVLAADGASPRVDVAAPLVFVGFGVVAPEYGWDELAGVDVRGKIAIVLDGAPRSDDPGFFPDLPGAVHADRCSKMERLRDRGAVGVVHVYTPQREATLPWARAVQLARHGGRVGIEAGRPSTTPLGIPLRATITGATFDRILEAAGVDVRLADLIASARQRRVPRLPPLAIEAEAHVRVAHDDAVARNVVAFVPGRDPELSGEPVLFTAHLDHFGVGTPVAGDGIFNGAADNATGVAQLLEIGRAFGALPERPPRPVVLAAVTGEEFGFLGSLHLARHPWPAGARYAAVVNLDEAAWIGPIRDVVALGADESTLAGHARAAADALGLVLSPDPAPELVYFVRSDHWSFVKAGIPGLMLFEGFLDDTGGAERKAAVFERYERDRYHSPKDEWDATFDAPAMADFARAAFLVGLSIALDPERPRWKEGSYLRRFAEGPSEGGACTPGRAAGGTAAPAP